MEKLCNVLFWGICLCTDAGRCKLKGLITALLVTFLGQLSQYLINQAPLFSFRWWVKRSCSHPLVSWLNREHPMTPRLVTALCHVCWSPWEQPHKQILHSVDWDSNWMNPRFIYDNLTNKKLTLSEPPDLFSTSCSCSNCQEKQVLKKSTRLIWTLDSSDPPVTLPWAQGKALHLAGNVNAGLLFKAIDPLTPWSN